MLFGNRADRYPYFISYLHETERIDLFRDFRGQETLTTGIGITAALGAFGVILLFQPLVAVAALGPLLIMALVTCGIVNLKRRAALRTPEFESKVEAYQLLAVMRRMLQLNRLHRDLSDSTLTLLDEIARLRGQIHDILNMPFWQQSHLSSTLIELKRQALVAADQSTIDAVLQFRNSLPVQVQARPVWSYIDEAVETVSGRANRATPFTELGFDGAFRVAQKMQTLKSEIEQLTNSAPSGVAGEVQQVPGALIDDALMEIRTIRAAEEELRLGL